MKIENNHISCPVDKLRKSEARHQISRFFWLLGPAYMRWAESHMHKRGMTPQRLRLLGVLFEQGAMQMSHLRNELGVSATNVTALVDALEKEGWVKRVPHLVDRRIISIALTAKAEKQLPQDCVEFGDQVAEIFSVYTKAEQKQFLGCLIKMKDELVARGILEQNEVSVKARKNIHEN